MSKDLGLGRCVHHPRRWAVVGLQGAAVCISCFEKSMEAIGKTIRAAIAVDAGHVEISLNLARGNGEKATA